MLSDDLLAAERDDQDGADVGMLAIGGERIVGHPQVRTELSASGGMWKGRPDRSNRRGHALSDHG